MIAMNDPSFFFFVSQWHHSSSPKSSLLLLLLPALLLYPSTHYYYRPLPLPLLLFPLHWPTFSAPVEMEGKIFILVNGKTRLEREVLPVNRCCERNFLLRPSSSTSSSKGKLGKTGLRDPLKFISQKDYNVHLHFYLRKFCLLSLKRTRY